MSQFFAYIATKTTADPYLPPATPDIRILARDVSDAFVALSGGYQRVGELKFFPLQGTVAGHLLCDGREVSKISFPELYGFLGDTQGTPANAANFVLPNFVGAASFDPAPVAEPEVEVGGSVTTTPPTVPDPDIDYWWKNYDPADSGGRFPY